jgi:hypothetical protein
MSMALRYVHIIRNIYGLAILPLCLPCSAQIRACARHRGVILAKVFESIF